MQRKRKRERKGRRLEPLDTGKLIPASINGKPGRVAFFSAEAAAAYGFALESPCPNCNGTGKIKVELTKREQGRQRKGRDAA